MISESTLIQILEESIIQDWKRLDLALLMGITVEELEHK